jgi:membrane-associated phospholipid phosphatase
LLALVNLAMADGFIAGFEAKFYYNIWRPVSAVHEGGDATWQSYLWAPPVPDFPSTHTVLGAAAATVLAQVFGSDYVSFSMMSGQPYPNITRRFWSFSQAAQENGASRVLAGIHFPSAVDAGYKQGAAIGEWTFHHALQRLEPSPTMAIKQ